MCVDEDYQRQLIICSLSGAFENVKGNSLCGVRCAYTVIALENHVCRLKIQHFKTHSVRIIEIKIIRACMAYSLTIQHRKKNHQRYYNAPGGRKQRVKN